MSNYDKCLTAAKVLDTNDKLTDGALTAFVNQVVAILSEGLAGSLGPFTLPQGPVCPETGESVFSFKPDKSAALIGTTLLSSDSQWNKTWPDIYAKMLASVNLAGATPFMALGVFDPTGAFPSMKLPAQPQPQDIISALVSQLNSAPSPPNPPVTPATLPVALLAAGLSAAPPLPPIPPIPVTPPVPGVSIPLPVGPGLTPPPLPLPGPIPDIHLVPPPPPTQTAPAIPFIANAFAVTNYSFVLMPTTVFMSMLPSLLDPSAAQKLLNPVALPSLVFDKVISALMSAVGASVGVDLSGPTVAVIPKTLIATVLAMAKGLAAAIAVCLVSQVLGSGTISGGLATAFGLVS